MIFGGLGAAVESLGPVLLPYDAAFLGVGTGGIATINPRLIQFLQHDRITLAGTMIAIGILYSSLSWFGIRSGLTWARDALLASGVVGFPTLWYFVAFSAGLGVVIALMIRALQQRISDRNKPLSIVAVDEKQMSRTTAFRRVALMRYAIRLAVSSWTEGDERFPKPFAVISQRF